jgi:hypothetical protein
MMSVFVGVILFIMLATIALLHAYWAFGGLWPAATEQDLINTVVGARHLKNMPATGMTLVVAALILSAGFVALAASGVLSVVPQWLARIAALGAAMIFLARGVAGLARLSIFKTWIAEPFATLNAQFYSPLCLAMGAAFLFLALANPAKAAP